MNKIEYNIEPLKRLRDEDYGEASARARARKLCPMPIQKETPTGLVDTVCNGDVNDNSAGLCRWAHPHFDHTLNEPVELSKYQF